MAGLEGDNYQRYNSWRVLSSTLELIASTNPTPSTSPGCLKCSCSFSIKCLVHAITPASCMPRIVSATAIPERDGSGLKPLHGISVLNFLLVDIVTYLPNCVLPLDCAQGVRRQDLIGHQLPLLGVPYPFDNRVDTTNHGPKMRLRCHQR